MLKMITNRSLNLGTETAFSVLAGASELAELGKEIINLGIGQPDFLTPEHIVEAGIKALRDGHHGYTQASGIPKLREAVCTDIYKRHNVEISPENILIVPGGKVIIFFSSMLLGDHNREILYPNPGFPIYESAIRFSGAKPVPYRLSEEIGFSFSADDILSKINEKTSLIIINSPSNPTGGVIPKNEIDKLIEGLEKFPNTMLMSDEIYDQFCFGKINFTSILKYPSIRDRLIILNGWSKTYAMTGWRLGYGIFPDALIEAADKLAVNVHSCVNASAQFAAMEALNGPQDCVTSMNSAFKMRSKIMFEELNKLELISCNDPQGAFYCFPNISKLNLSSLEFQNKLLNETGVAAIAGTSFGEYGEGYLRFSCASSETSIRKAIEKLSLFLSKL